MKRCTGPCGRTLPLSAFHRDPSKSDGRTSRCRDCRSAYARTRRRERAAEHRQREREALAADPTAQRAIRRSAPALAALTPDPDPEAAERVARIAALAEEALRRRR